MELEKLGKNVFVIHPCVEDSSKVICEGSLFGEIQTSKEVDISKLCGSLQKNSEIKGIRCSEILGLLKFKVGIKTITLFKNGRIIIRMAENEKDVLETMKLIQDLSKDFIL